MPRKKTRRPAFGTVVKLELIKRDMTSRDLAREIGIADSTLCDVIMGRNRSEATRTKIIEALHLLDSVQTLPEDGGYVMEQPGSF